MRETRKVDSADLGVHIVDWTLSNDRKLSAVTKTR